MKLPALHIGNLTATVPIVQGGMGIGVSLSGLASAVANEGGVGVISAANVGFNEPDLLYEGARIFGCGSNRSSAVRRPWSSRPASSA